MLTRVSVSSQPTLTQAQYRAIGQDLIIKRLAELHRQAPTQERKDVLQQAIERAQAGKSS